MGFYSPATLVKDAQRHGLRVLPIDVARSDWLCSAEKTSNGLALRLGLNYVKGLRELAGLRIVRERARRAFTSIDDVAHRVPELQKKELALLAEVGALNFLDKNRRIHRRDALWQIERACRPSGPLFDSIPQADGPSPLSPMHPEERLLADFRVSGLTTGPHPMSFCRNQLDPLGVRRAIDLKKIPNGVWVKTAGCVIARQRPATAKGFVFLSIEDETGIANAIFTPDMLEKHRALITTERFVLIEGRLQHVDNVISVKAYRISPLAVAQAQIQSRDFF